MRRTRVTLGVRPHWLRHGVKANGRLRSLFGSAEDLLARARIRRGTFLVTEAPVNGRFELTADFGDWFVFVVDHETGAEGLFCAAQLQRLISWFKVGSRFNVRRIK